MSRDIQQECNTLVIWVHVPTIMAPVGSYTGVDANARAGEYRNIPWLDKRSNTFNSFNT